MSNWTPDYLRKEKPRPLTEEQIDELVYGGHLTPHDIVYWGREEAIKRAIKELEESKK